MKKNPVMLIVDDQPENLDTLVDCMEARNLSVMVALNGEKAIELSKEALPDIILLDVLLPDINGFEVCKKLKESSATKDIPVIFMTALTDIEDKIKGFNVGGIDYITKPIQLKEVEARVDTHLTISQQRREMEKLIKQLQQETNRREEVEQKLESVDEKLNALCEKEAEHWGISGFIGRSQTITKILDDIRCLQNRDKTSVLILGESGTGKELIARALHYSGLRSKGPFVPVNCSAIPTELAESSFFGHIRGAFSGAIDNRKGFFEQAQDGTLFLDEIGDMPLQLQAKLLRALESGYISPVGSGQPKKIDVRIIAATNANLENKMWKNHFRQDLYFRLASFIITIPPLRERKDDILSLAEHFVNIFAKEMGYQKAFIDPEAIKALTNYDYPGNVRELKNIMENALIRSRGSCILTNHLNFIQKPGEESRLFTPQISKIKVNTSDQDRIIFYLKEYSSINNSQCRELLNINSDRASYLLRKMCNKGLLQKKGESRETTYHLV